MRLPRGGCRGALAVALASLTMIGCEHASTTVRYRAERWEAADRLFREDARWRGGDAAYSAPLDDERTLWLFGDSFIVPEGNVGRDGATMVRNTIGVMRGRDPVTASMTFHFRDGEPPSAFFASGAPDADEDGTWRWPGPAVVVDGRLIVFLLDVARAEGGLGFSIVGGRALSTTAFEGPPEAWGFESLALPTAPPGVLVAAGGLLLHGEHLYGYAPVEPGDHRVFLARWSSQEVAAGRLDTATWWDGQGFSDDAARASAVFADGQTELSVHAARRGQELVVVQVDGFGGADVAVRVGGAPQGPFSSLTSVHRPVDADRDGILIYSAKAHPAFTTPAGMAVTYCTNHLDFWTMAGDDALYTPRFVLLMADDD